MLLQLLEYQASSLPASQLLLLISWAGTIEMSILINSLSFQIRFRFCRWRGGLVTLRSPVSGLLTEHV